MLLKKADAQAKANAEAAPPEKKEAKEPFLERAKESLAKLRRPFENKGNAAIAASALGDIGTKVVANYLPNVWNRELIDGHLALVSDVHSATTPTFVPALNLLNATGSEMLTFAGLVATGASMLYLSLGKTRLTFERKIYGLRVFGAGCLAMAASLPLDGWKAINTIGILNTGLTVGGVSNASIGTNISDLMGIAGVMIACTELTVTYYRMEKASQAEKETNAEK